MGGSLRGQICTHHANVVEWYGKCLIAEVLELFPSEAEGSSGIGQLGIACTFGGIIFTQRRSLRRASCLFTHGVQLAGFCSN